MPVQLPRRALLLGAGVAAATGIGAGRAAFLGELPGRPALQEILGLNGPDGQVPDIEPGPITRGRFVSAARGGIPTDWVLIRPPGVGGPLPLVVALHALGWRAESVLEPAISLPRFLAAAVEDGVPPFAIVAADGGRTYWHPRPDGEDAGAMVCDELLPLVERQGQSVDRFGLMGWSMGGYGALRLAGLLGAGRVPAVVAASPAIWSDADDARKTGFATKKEYLAHTVFGRQDQLEQTAVRIDIGTGDALYRWVEDYVEDFPDSADLTVTFEAGGHTAGYWRRMLPTQLEHLGTRISA